MNNFNSRVDKQTNDFYITEAVFKIINKKTPTNKIDFATCIK